MGKTAAFFNVFIFRKVITSFLPVSDLADTAAGYVELFRICDIASIADSQLIAKRLRNSYSKLGLDGIQLCVSSANTIEFVSPNRDANNMWDRTFGFWFNAIPLLIQQGFLKLKTVLVAGQYHHPTGFSFGGTKLQPSIEIITMLLKDMGFNTGDTFWIGTLYPSHKSIIFFVFK